MVDDVYLFCYGAVDVNEVDLAVAYADETALSFLLFALLL